MPNIENVASSSSDLSVATGTKVVYWLYVEAGATGGAWSLEDGTDASGTVKLSGSKVANTDTFFYFGDAPIEMKTGIYLDIGGTNVTMTLGYR